MTFHLRPEIETRLAAIAAAHGPSADDYLAALLERESLIEAPDASTDEPVSGMVIEESGLRVYRTGKPLPVSLIDDAVRRVRDERSLHIRRRSSLKIFFDSSVPHAVSAGSFGPAAESIHSVPWGRSARFTPCCPGCPLGHASRE